MSDLIHEATGADQVRNGVRMSAGTVGTEMSNYTSTTQSPAGARYAVAMPWRDDRGELNFTFSLLSSAPVLSSEPPGDPVGIQGRFVDTASATFTEAVQHGRGNNWRATAFTKQYSDASTLTVNVATDASDDQNLQRPVVGYGDFEPQIDLRGIPALPAGQDWQGVFIRDSLTGSLDGVPGIFTPPDISKCLPLVGCYMEFNRNSDASGYFPRGSVLFTPNDPDTPETIFPDTWTESPLPRIDTLSFGDWLYVPSDTTSADEYDFGVLGGGGDPYSSSLHDLAGTVTYVGIASGRCFTGRSSTNSDLGSFDADVTVTVNFDEGVLSGSVQNFRTDAVCEGLPTELQLEPATIDPSGAAGTVADGLASSWAGQWRAAFYGNGENPAVPPTGIAGTFGLSDDDRGLSGGFGARP